MKRLSTVIEDEIAEKFEKKAKSLGLTPSAYLRNIVAADLKKQENMLSLRDIQKSITALLPAFVEAIGRTQKASPEQKEALKTICLKAWEESFRNEKN